MSYELLERHDNFAGMRNALRSIAANQREWAGIPIPLEDHPLVIEPKYPGAEILSMCGRKEAPPADESAETIEINRRNIFHSRHKRCDIFVWSENGRIEWGVQRAVHHFDQDMMTLGASVVWGFEQEARAVQLLATLVRHHQLKQYMLTGMFLESSKRSGVTYVFRRLRPTIALGKTPTGALKILCAMCLHPIAYYEGSWAGAMCPTDDVIAHLMLMRGDEPMFWRRANQHPAWRPEAGL